MDGENDMLDYIDLVSLLRDFGYRGLEKVEVYGRIVSRLPRPVNIYENVKLSKTGMFVRVNVFSINLGRYDSYLKQTGAYNDKHTYMVNGSIIAFIEKTNKPLPEWYCLRGTLRFGSKDLSNTYVGLLTYYKDGSDWALKPSDYDDFPADIWGTDNRLYSYLCKSRDSGSVVIPSDVELMPRFDAVLKKTNEPVVPNTGSSLEGSLAKALNNVKPQQTSVVNFVKECRQDIKEPNELYNKFKDLSLNALNIREQFLNECKDDYKLDDDSDYEPLIYMVRHIGKTHASKAVLKKYLSNIKGSQERYLGKQTISSYLISIFDDEIADFILTGSTVTASGEAWEVCKSAFCSREYFYAGILGVILGISFDDLSDIVYKCESLDMSFMRVVNENPYLLQLISSLKFDTIEKIAICFGQHTNPEVKKFRNIAMLNAYILDSNNESTVFYRDKLINEEFGVALTKVRYNYICEVGTYFSSVMINNIDECIRQCTRSELGYSASRFKSIGGNRYVERIDSREKVTVIDDYVKSGLGILLDNKFITSSMLLERELFVFDKMQSLGKKTFNYDDVEIDKYIAEYEAQVGFKLEERQVMAVHLIKHAGFVVAGSAGSGKTTVSNCIVYVLSKLEPNLERRFAAPTGKAAKRMQEVVKCNVKTLHSEFHLGLEQKSVFDSDEEELNSDNIAYFFDEGAMITLDLLYSVLSKIDEDNCRIFLFGDFNQLPPIGKGLPFKNLLRFMPCVFLNVTKRAVEGSKITYNSNIINDNSTDSTWKNLQSGDDFFLLQCSKDKIQEVVARLCRYYLGKGTPEDSAVLKQYLGVDTLPEVENLRSDDIQVVSPLSKSTYTWGTVQLNKKLQPIFNTVRGYDKTFVYQLTAKSEPSKFVIGDRVIHVEKNMYSMQWYESYENGVFVKRYGYGICNGEVGKFVGMFESSDCIVEDEQEDEPSDFKYKDNMRDDSTWNGDGKYFIVVEYWDYITESNFYILYRAEVNTSVDSGSIGVVLKGDDLGMLNLFYAGTTHKLQGSQAKLVIACLDSVNYSGFITREQLYTMFTRGEKLVFVVGSVDNSRASMLSRARRDLACTGIDTIGEIII